MIPNGSAPRSDPAAQAEIRAALGEVLGAWRARYGVVVAALEVATAPDGGATIRGTVLVPSQRRALEQALSGALAARGLRIEDVALDVEALTSREACLGWYRPDALLDVRAQPDAQGALSTQWAAEDPPFRALSREAGWAAVELPDRTVGWARLEGVTPLAPEDAPASVAAWRAGWAGEARAASEADWREALQPWIGTPYLLGGRSRAGVDCSALTQQLFRAAQGIGLPRHSKDQSRFGARVPREALASGDLLYLTHMERGLSHTALVLMGPAAAHASLDHQQVILEPLEDLLARYQLRAARRFPSGTAPLAP